MKDDDLVDAAERDAVLTSYRRLGPVWWRLLTVGKAVAVVVIWIVVGLCFATLESLHHGTGVKSPSAEERTAVAQVGECHRKGPVSDDGFGFWWDCEVVVTVADGRVVHTTVDDSTVSPADAGQAVEFREACADGGTDDCHYGRPVSWAWGVPLGLLSMVRIALTLVLLGGFVIYLVMAVVGPQRYYSRVDRRRAAKSPPPSG